MASPSDSTRLYEIRSLEVGSDLPQYHDWVVDAFRAQLHGRVIEVGAGIGTVAERYAGQVDEAVLVEPARNLHEVLASKFAGKRHVRTFCGLLEEAVGRDLDGVRVESGTFDAAIMVNVLEHIEDDIGTLRTLNGLLRPGGHVLIFVPALPVLYGPIDVDVGHVRRYTRPTLRRAIEAAGFEVRQLYYFDLLGMVPWFVTGRILRRQGVGHGSARVYDKYIVPVCRTVDALVKPRLGKNLVCVATRS